MNAFGELLRSAREKRGLTLRAFARSVGCCPAYISDVELGKRAPLTGEKLTKASLMLKLPMRDLAVAAAASRGNVSVGLSLKDVVRVMELVERLRAGGTR